METTLETVLKSIASGNTALVAGMELGADGNLIPSAKMLAIQQQNALGQMSDMNFATPHITGASSVSPVNSASLPPLPTPLPHSKATPAQSTTSSADRIASIKLEEAAAGAVQSSPGMRLHSLPEPENTWAPLGLLAE